MNSEEGLVLLLVVVVYWLVGHLYVVHRNASYFDWLLLKHKLQLPESFFCPSPALTAFLFLSLSLEAVAVFLLWQMDLTLTEEDDDLQQSYRTAAWILILLRLLMISMWAPFLYGALALHVHCALALLAAIVQCVVIVLLLAVHWEAGVIYGLNIVFSWYYVHYAFVLFRANRERWTMQHTFAPQAFYEIANETHQLRQDVRSLQTLQQITQDAINTQHQQLEPLLMSAKVRKESKPPVNKIPPKTESVLATAPRPASAARPRERRRAAPAPLSNLRTTHPIDTDQLLASAFTSALQYNQV